MDTTYHVIRADGSKTTSTTTLPQEPTFEQIKAIVSPALDGEPLERVRVLVDDRYTDMFVSELGHRELTTRPPLPINADATRIYRANWLKQHPDDDPDSLPAIAGTALLFDSRVWF